MVYEDLSKDPASELARIGAFTGIDPSRAIVAIQAGQAFAAGHELAGNRLLRSGSIVFRRDPESRKRWPGGWGALGNTLAWLFLK